jgi:hypothetical protein
MKVEVTRSSETSVYNEPTWRHIPEGGILHTHRREKPQIQYFKCFQANSVQHQLLQDFIFSSLLQRMINRHTSQNGRPPYRRYIYDMMERHDTPEAMIYNAMSDIMINRESSQKTAFLLTSVYASRLLVILSCLL